MSRPKALIAALSCAAAAWIAGCHSYHIDTTIENRTGEPIRLLEIDYPGGSFGANSLATGADYRYRIQLRGSGQVKIQYTALNGSQKQTDGPVFFEGQEGRLEIVLRPGGQAEFHPAIRNNKN